MRPHRSIVIVLATLLALLWQFWVGPPARAVEPLQLYDDFNAALLNPDKWSGSQVVNDCQPEESVRQINGNIRLRLTHRVYGSNASNSGAPACRFALNFSNPPAVTAIKATVKVKEVISTGCPANTSPTRARARLFGEFFNTGTPTPGSAVDDVVTFIALGRSSDSADPPDVLRVTAMVNHCLDADCDTTTQLDSLDLGTAPVETDVVLKMQWDPDNNRFIFQRDSDPEVFSSYAVSDSASPGRNLKRLDISNNVARCIMPPRPQAWTKAAVDDVFANDSAVP